MCFYCLPLDALEHWLKRQTIKELLKSKAKAFQTGGRLQRRAFNGPPTLKYITMVSVVFIVLMFVHVLSSHQWFELFDARKTW